MAESNGEWGALAEHDDELAAQWDGFARLPDPGVNDVLDAFCARKRIDIPALVRLGARLSDTQVLAFAYSAGIKFRNMENGQRWTAADSLFPKLKIVRAREGKADIVILAEGETDGAKLTMLYPGCDVAVMPAGARRFTPDYAAQLEPYARVLVGLDNDTAGEAGHAKILTLVSHAERFAPPDANDWCALEADPPPIPDAGPQDDRVGGVTFTSERFMAALRGELKPPKVLVDDLLYDEGVHWVSGHPASGKSILALMIAQVAMGEGRHVAWLDYEQGERMTGQRLREMGASVEMVERLFHYAWTPKSAEKHLAELAEHFTNPVIVVDSVSKALRYAGLDENSAGDVTGWTNHLIAAAKGYRIPIVAIDHIAKQTAKESKYARGSGAKLADADVHLVVDKVEEFNRETIGTIHIRTAKDREAFLPYRQAYRIGDGCGNLPIVPTDVLVAEDDEPRI